MATFPSLPAPASDALAAGTKRPREEAAPEDEPFLPSLQALDEARQVYNQRVSKQASGIDWKANAKQAEDVSRKTQDFCRCFSKSVRVTDVASGKPILANIEQFESRYRTVFRESGKDLQMQVHHRGQQ